MLYRHLFHVKKTFYKVPLKYLAKRVAKAPTITPMINAIKVIVVSLFHLLNLQKINL